MAQPQDVGGGVPERQWGAENPAGAPHAGGQRATGSSGDDPGDAGKIVDALKAASDQEFNISERLSAKARQGFVLAAGVFTISQTVAFNTFEAGKLNGHEKHWIIGLAVTAVGLLFVAALGTIKADATFSTRDLPLEKLESDLNAAYEGDKRVVGRLGGYYLGIVRTRREANQVRGKWYKRGRTFVMLSLAATVAELIFSLISRTT